MNDADNISPLIPAATVILIRDGAKGLETLMLRRNRSLRSFGGMWVFPGGRVDPNDAPGEDDITRARAASCREAAEETGLYITPQDLVSLSHWIPPLEEKRRFSTRFFVAKAPAQAVIIDDGEIRDYSWVSPKEVVVNAPDPRMIVVPPTFVSLADLSVYDCVNDALTGIASQPDEFFETRFTPTDAGFVTFWQPDSGYDNGDLTLPGPRRRLVTTAQEWTYLKD